MPLLCSCVMSCDIGWEHAGNMQRDVSTSGLTQDVIKGLHEATYPYQLTRAYGTHALPPCQPLLA